MDLIIAIQETQVAQEIAFSRPQTKPAIIMIGLILSNKSVCCDLA
jgi:hypothetical protein